MFQHFWLLFTCCVTNHFLLASFIDYLPSPYLFFDDSLIQPFSVMNMCDNKLQDSPSLALFSHRPESESERGREGIQCREAEGWWAGAMWLWSLFPHVLYIDIAGFGPCFSRMHLLESFPVRLQLMSPDRCEAEKDFTEETCCFGIVPVLVWSFTQ